MTRVTHRSAATAWVAALSSAFGACTPAPPPKSGPSIGVAVGAPSDPATRTAPAPPGPVRHVLVVTIDGLMPDAYLHPDAHGLQVPVLRRLVAQGASSDGALSVFPTLTYPAHTSIASGVTPSRHGIVSNLAFDPLEKNQEAWRWYDEEVAVPRIWDVARAAGYSTALIDWPVTVGETATFHVPEMWRARTSEDLKLIRALSTPGLLEEVAATYPNFTAGFRPPDLTDESGTDIAAYVLTKAAPALLFLHIWQVDAAEHRFGLWSAEASAAIENADHQLGRLLDATEQAGMAGETALVVASDHGFANVTRCVNPSVLLRRAGLLEVDAQGQLRDWQAAVLAAAANAYVYLRRPDDVALQAATRKVFEDAQRDATSGIARVLGQAEIQALGGDPDAFLALDAQPGTYFGRGRTNYETPPGVKATHGYDPHRPEMLASLVLFGANVPHGKLAAARLVDIAPTVAAWLGLELGPIDGKALESVP